MIDKPEQIVLSVRYNRTMIDHLKALAVFATTVEQGSFRGAARVLGLSPSVVSHHVSGLERRLGVALLYRTTRKLSLTSDGEQLFRSAREMLHAAERGLDAISGASTTPTGTLRLTAPAILIDTRFTRDLAAFARTLPHVAISIAFTEQRHDLLRDGLDLAIRIGHLDDSSLKMKKLATMRRVLISSPAYVATRPRARRLADLEGWDFVTLSALPPTLEAIPPRRKTPLKIALAPRVTTDSATAMRELVLAGAGIAGIPELVAREALQRGRLVEVLPAWRMTSRDVYAVWPGGTPRPGLTARFVDFIEPRLRELFAA